MMKQRQWIKNLPILLGILTLSVVLTACGPARNNGAHKNGQLNVVTTTDFYGEVAQAVLGDKGKVTSIINKPSMDPHDYEPTPAVAKQVADASVVVANGLGYDSWMDRLVDSTQGKFVRVGEDVMHQKNGDNPHLWYNPKTMPALANDLAVKLGKLQPKNKAYFTQNARKYIATLKPVAKELNRLKQTAKTMKNKQVFVSEPVFDYAIDAMGFKVGDREFEKAIENETDPAPQTLTAIHQGLKKRQVAFFVYNKQVNNKLVENLVAMAKANRVPVLPVTETLPAHQNYQSWMVNQYRELNRLLQS